MNAPRGEETVFAEALRLPPEERAAYLDQATHGSPELRRRIELLLGSYGAGDFLEEAAASELRPTIALSVALTEKPGDMIGRYKLLQQIGEGGCGVVYMAEQSEPVRRRVALKIIKLGMDTKSVIARFEAERQALAMMDHPNIAKVLDAGATETGRPYFAMELVRGMKITEYCDEAKLSTRARLDLFVQVCQAIQHAHQKGIIHRDIKPSNILVTVNDGVAVPKVIDFGIAKATSGQQLTDKTLFTAFEQFIGTPAYMSPEQAVLTSLDIDTRSDIYALGVLLYELLTGRTPFDAKELLAIGLDEMRRAIREQEPQRPSTRVSTLPDPELSTTAQRRGLAPPRLVSELRGDLDWIVMKAMEKDRARRYETANGLAADIQRHLNNEAVVACPPSRLYRLRKTMRRNRLVFTAAGAVTAALILGLGIATWMYVREREAKNRAVVAEQAERSALLYHQKKYAEAVALYKQAFATSGKSFRARNESLALLGRDLMVNLTRVGQLSEAADLARDFVPPNLETWPDLFREVGRLADQMFKAGKFEDGIRLLNNLLSQTPDDLRLLEMRADFLARGGRYDDAAADYRRLIELNPNRHGIWQILAAVLAFIGQQGEYDVTVLQFLNRFSGDTASVERRAKSCLLMPSSPENTRTAIKLADGLDPKLIQGPAGGWFALTKGLAEYRRGAFQAAIEYLRQASEEYKPDACRAIASAVAAMAHYQLNQKDQADSALSEAKALEGYGRTKVRNGDPGDWGDWLRASILVREASALIDRTNTSSRATE